MRQHILCIFLAHLVVNNVSAFNSTVNCTAGTFEENSAGSVHCDFGSNINDTKQNFNVVLYPSSQSSDGLSSSAESSGTETYVLLCNWDNAGKLVCKVEEGFIFDLIVTDRLTVKVSRVTPKTAGLYVCQLVPSDGVKSDTCTLTIAENIDDPTTGQLLDIKIIFILALSAFCGLLLLGFIITCLCIRRRCVLVRKARKKTAPDNTECGSIPKPTHSCCGLVRSYPGAYYGLSGGETVIFLNKQKKQDKEVQTDGDVTVDGGKPRGSKSGAGSKDSKCSIQ